MTVDTCFNSIPKPNRITVERAPDGNEAAIKEEQQNNGRRKLLNGNNEP